MRLLVFALLVLTGCMETCPTPLVQTCEGPTRVMTCGTDHRHFETRDCNAVLPRSRRWTCCRPVGEPTAELSCLPEVDCDPSYARRPTEAQ